MPTVARHGPIEPELRGNLADFRFRDTVDIEALPFRDSPYWHWLLTCRHIGVHRPDDRSCNWTARIMTKEGVIFKNVLDLRLTLGVAALAATRQ